MALQVAFVAALLGGLVAAPAFQGGPGTATATATVVLRADLKSHTALRVSTSRLRFDVDDDGRAPRLSIDFSAAARTVPAGEVVLTVEPVGDVRDAEGGAVPGGVVKYEGDGRYAGTLANGARHVVGTWTGSGVRTGSAAFTLVGVNRPGVYLLDLKFVLSAP